MALKLFVVDDVTGNCDLRQLTPYTSVTSTDGSIVVTQSVGPNGQPVYDLAGSTNVDINVDNLAYDPVTKILTLTETDGTTHPINLSDLVDTETVTTLVPDGSGGFNYTSENGTVTNIPAHVTSTVTQIVTGNEIATHNDGNGNTVSIQETVTGLTDNGDSSFTFTDEDGNDTTISACDLISNAADTGQFIGG